MKLIKEMKIKVVSEITNLSPSGAPEGEPEISEERAEAFLHFSDGELLISYRTDSEGGEVTTDITVRDGRVLVVRRGAVGCDFLFEEGKEHRSVCSVGPYSFDASVMARRIRLGIGEYGGRIDLYYGMNIGGADKYA